MSGYKRKSTNFRNAALWAVLVPSGLCAHAQGVLTITPGRSAATLAGTGVTGYAGDGSSASAALVARPSGIAYDAAGDLFLADTNNHVIREVSATGVVTTVAGTGVAGFGGDGGAATAAFLDTPTSVAIDAGGNLYIADSHNHRIRKVSSGTIATIAGTGTAGFSGDGGAATTAQLALPSGVAVDASGNVYIADTNNHRIRKIAAGAITTFAGNGEELLAGDNGPATAASLDQPTSVTVDAAGNLYIADKNNHRIRVVSSIGTISTLAGSGMANFAGGFSGDGGTATSAVLARPVGVSVDLGGNLYVADTNNHRVRQVSASGAITTVAGTGDQGFGGDGGPATNAILDLPRATATDANGNLAIADTRNQRLRSASLGQLTFSGQAVGTTSVPQNISLANTGTGAITISAVALKGPFVFAGSGTCSAAPVLLQAGASCTENIAYQPAASGNASGSITFGGSGVGTQTVLLFGAAATGGTTMVSLQLATPAVLSGESTTFTATVTVQGSASVPTGLVSFYDGATALGSSNLVNGVATLTMEKLPDGVQTITAVYASGGAGFGSSTSIAVPERVADFNIDASGSNAFTLEPGHGLAVPLTLAAVNTAGLKGTVSLAIAGLAAGLTANIAPGTAPLSDGQTSFTMNVTAAPTIATMQPSAAGAVVLAFCVVPLIASRRSRLRGVRPLLTLLLIAGSGALLIPLTGCGGNTGFFGQPQKTYNVTVNATAIDSTGGTLVRSAVVTITVQ